MSDYRELIKLLKGHKVYLQTHNYPDPDALASAMGLKSFLSNFDIETVICHRGMIEKNNTKKMCAMFSIESYDDSMLTDMTEEDYIVTIDGQKHNSNFVDLIGDEVACIDHHPTVIECEYKYKDVRICGACSSIIASYFKKSGIIPDENTATALLYGLKMDTDGFYRGVTSFDIEMYKFLFKYANNDMISHLLNSTMEIDDLHAYGEAIKNIKIYDNVGIAKINFECPDALIAMVSDFILCLDVVEFAVIYAKRSGGYKFSVRSETSYLDSGKIICKALEGIGSGGGHLTMAGGYSDAESVKKYGNRYDSEIVSRFLDVISSFKSDEHIFIHT